MCDLHFKFEEDHTKTVVAIERIRLTTAFKEHSGIVGQHPVRNYIFS